MTIQTDPTLVSPQMFRATMGRFATGVTIITSAGEGGALVGMTVNSLTSVSLDPCLLLVCLKRGSITGAAIRARRSFAVNLLAADQADLALRFARPVEDRFAGLGVALTDQGVPLIDGAAAHIVCDLHSITEIGDHDVIFGQVTRSVHDNAAEPLVFRGGGFGRYTPVPAP